MFTDRVKVEFIAGKGGNGVVAWHRAKYIPKGGPSGGNGGKGGSVILEADQELSSLEWFRHKKRVGAENGGQGGSNKCQGKCGKDLILKVPTGTLLKDQETGNILYDFTVHGEKYTLCVGGRGGRGNESFKTPTNQAPNFCIPGSPGEVKRVELELKLIADVGLVGFPNAGKSTLIGALAGLKVKIAAYPFTTLQPNIGFIQLKDEKRIYIADIPGIIENAHKNRGLGLEFLRHIERTKLLLFVLDSSGIDGRDPYSDFIVLQNELREYDPLLLERPSLIVLNKIDDDTSAEHLKNFHEKYTGPKDIVVEASAILKVGLSDLLEKIIHILN